MAPRLFLLAVALVTIACTAPTQYRFVHTTGGNNYERDRYECLREAAAVPQVAPPSGAPPRYPTGGGFEAGMRYGEARRSYDDATALSVGQQDLQTQLLVMCMQNRGYRLEQQNSEEPRELMTTGPSPRPIKRVLLTAPPDESKRQDRWPVLKDFDDVPACENDRVRRLTDVDALRQKIPLSSPDRAKTDAIWQRLSRAKCIDRTQPPQPLR